MDMTGRVALVTGASGAIGADLARGFADAGAAVVVHYRTNKDVADELVDELHTRGAQACAFGADLTDEQQATTLVEETTAWHGRLDAVVNNHGIQPLIQLDSLTEADWHSMLDANLTSVVTMTKVAARTMDHGGAITQISSIEAMTPDAAHAHAHYGVAKAAVLRYTLSAAAAYGPRGVRVNAVCPGLIDRPGLAEHWPTGIASYRGAAPLGRVGTGTDIAYAVLFLCSPLASWITGQTITVDGGISTRPCWGG